MSKNSKHDMDRYFNDPEYRKEIRAKKNSPDESKEQLVPPKVWYYFKIVSGIFALFVTGYVIFLFLGLPPIEDLENPQTATASEVVSRDGVVLDRYFNQDRKYVRIDEISPNVINALIATEDHRFYNHWGMDMIRTLAIPFHVLRGRPQGGSTISQQLARNLYVQIGLEFSLTRKFREMITAIQIENNFTKQEIIELYLNTVEFSNSAYGIERAARTHYNKSALDLTVSEAATMIGVLRAIYYYNPRHFPERAQSRRNVVLSLMRNHGFITDEVYANLVDEPIALNYQRPSQSGTESRYFGEYVRQKVMQWTRDNGYDIYSDGLTIHTTIDSRLQRHGEQALTTNLETFQPIFEGEWTTPGGSYMNLLWERFPDFLPSFIRESDRYKNGFANYDTDQESVVFDSLYADEAYIDSLKRASTRLQAGFVAIDPTNGGVLAWIGGADYGSKQFDHVYQSRRQTGSTFKPFVYTVAIDNGYMPYHTFSKYPVSFIEPNGTLWDPRDPSIPDGPTMVPLRQGIARSLNNVTVRLLPEIAGNPGTNQTRDLIPAARQIKELATSFGIDLSNEPAYPSIALGTAESSLLELVSAYTTFANQGVHIDPIAVTRIEDKEGNILVEYHPEYTQEVISPETAYIMVDMMRGVIRGGNWGIGTGVRLANVYNVTQDVAGKTGTTQDSADNWFVAMMPHIVMGAWVGGEDRRIRFRPDLPSSIGQGARTALPIVGDFINRATADPEAETIWSYESFQPPPGFISPEDPSINQGNQNPNRGNIGW